MQMSPAAEAILRAADPKFRESADFSLLDTTIALFQTGSHAYGTNGPDSDNDYTAIVLPRMRHIVGLGQWDHWEPGKDDALDLKAMSLAKFVKLAVVGNPNVVEMLFFEPENMLYVAPAFQTLLDHREYFTSRDVFKRFSGYAASQMQKMEQGKHSGYMGHKRKELVEQLGYDPKDASHLIRLLFAGQDMALHGVWSPRLEGMRLDMVLEIKNGLWHLQDVKDLAMKISGYNEQLFQRPECPLPEKADINFIEILLMEIHREAVR